MQVVALLDRFTSSRSRKQVNAGLALCLVLYLCAVGGFAWWAHQRAHDRILDNIDEHLLMGAKSLKYLLAPDFHDRAVSPDAIGMTEIDRNRAMVSEFAAENNFAYAYTLVADHGRFFFSAPTVTAEELVQKRKGYYHPYDDVPEAFVRAFEENKTVYETYTDRWGTFRAVAHPQQSPGGTRYLACADTDISRIQSLLAAEYLRSGLLALVLTAFALPFVLLYIHHTRLHRRRYERVSQQLIDQKERSEQIASMAVKAHAELDQVFQCSAEGLMVIDPDNTIVRINQAYLDLIGQPLEDTLGRKCHEVFETPFCHGPECPFHKIRSQGKEIAEYSVDRCMPDGTSHPLMITVSALRSPWGELNGAVISLKDLFASEQTRQLQAAMTQAEAASKAKGEFLAKMSHEIRTPLNGIIGMTEVVQTTALDENQRRIMGIIVQESNHLLNIINNILDFSKIEAGKLEIEAIEFNLRQVMDEVGEGISLQASHKGLDLNVYLSPELPERLIGDPTRLRQVLLNLAGNALKFTEKGEVSIKGDLVSRAEDEVSVRFSVEDTGIGIPDDKKETIFESFTQADGSTTRKYGGTGLGTTISRQLVGLMGGRLHLRSQPDKGTNIRFTLPFGLPEQRSMSETQGPPILENRYVLVVDDCFTSRKIAAKYLETMGCRVREACDGREALAAFQSSRNKGFPFDLILTDYRMPHMNGFDLARRIRQMDGDEHTPIIAVSGLQEIVEIGNLQDLGFDHCLAKPLKIDELRLAMVAVSGFLPARPRTAACRPADDMQEIEANGAGKGRILLVEDYLTNQQVAIMHLTSAGYSVDLAQNGAQAVEKYSRATFDLILMDLEMPVMDGYSAAREIRRIEAERNSRDDLEPRTATPIIATTAHALNGYQEKCFKAGMDDFMAKPLRRSQLLAKVRHWLSSTTPGARCELLDPLDTRPDPGNDPAVEKPIDMQRALEEFLGQQEVLEKVLKAFQSKVQEQILMIDQALKTDDAETVRKEAHAIKGGAANLTAQPLADIALTLENIGKSGCLDNGASVLGALEGELIRLEAFLLKGV